MRSSLPLLLLVFVALRPAFAEQPYQTLSERLGTPRDENKVFDVRQGAVGGGKTFGTGAAQSKSFFFQQKVASKEYGTRGFWGSKRASLGDAKFAAKEANVKGKYLMPNVNQQVGNKSAPVKEARENSKALATRNLPGGDRTYLGKEREKMAQPLDATTMANWKLGDPTVSGEVIEGRRGRKIVTPTERYGEIKELSIDDVREILNKNK